MLKVQYQAEKAPAITNSSRAERKKRPHSSMNRLNSWVKVSRFLQGSSKECFPGCENAAGEMRQKW